jgi:HNH endonuclease
MNTRYEEIAHGLGFRVSACGLIVQAPDGRQMCCSTNRHGYRYFRAALPIGRKHVAVHRLQAFQKFGQELYREGFEVRHLDGRGSNNAAENIAVGTKSDNMMDRPKWLRSKLAARAHLKHDHSAVRSHYAQSKSYRATMLAYGISSKGTLHHILNRQAEQGMLLDTLADTLRSNQKAA